MALKILVVDDQSEVRELISLTLESEGHECMTAENGSVAIEIFENTQDVGIVLMDVCMPGIDGCSAVRLIKQIPRNQLCSVIFISAMDDYDTITSCLDAGGDDFICKPINKKLLIAKVNAHIRTKTLYDQLESANAQLQYHDQVMRREFAIVEQIYRNGLDYIETRCSNARSHTSPMSMFNGDILLEAPSPSGGVYHIVGDFTGHGLGASICTLPVSDIFYRCAAKKKSVGQIARKINARLLQLLPETMFLCATISYLDSSGKTLTLWSGGMNDNLHVHGGSNAKLDRIEGENMPLGVLIEEDFDEVICVVEFGEESRFYIYTDGISEACNASGEYFGLERLANYLLENRKNTVDSLISEVRKFRGEEDQSDDISILELHAGKVEHFPVKSNETMPQKQSLGPDSTASIHHLGSEK